MLRSIIRFITRKPRLVQVDDAYEAWFDAEYDRWYEAGMPRH